MKIAISQGIGSWRYLKYGEWLQSIDPSVEIVELSAKPEEEALESLQSCNGLILTGGPDLDPFRYGHEKRYPQYRLDPERDDREWKYVEVVMKQKMPVLGICRGMQLINVYFGGSLIIDILSDIPETRAHRGDEGDVLHNIICECPSFLGEPGAILAINSAHHQSAARIADSFEVIARSEDGVVEAIMPKKDTDLPWIFGAQWHPERFAEGDISEKIARAFLEACDR